MNERFGEDVIRFARALMQKKAADITLIDVRHLTVIADYFVVASGNSTTHVKSICDELIDEMAKQGVLAKRKEGYSEGRWIVIDYMDVLVHIFHKEERAYYNIERLWADGENQVEYFGTIGEP